MKESQEKEFQIRKKSQEIELMKKPGQKRNNPKSAFKMERWQLLRKQKREWTKFNTEL